MLANELLFGRLQQGGRVTVDAADGALVLRYEMDADASLRNATGRIRAAAGESVAPCCRFN